LEDKTIKEIADFLGVEKYKIYRIIKRFGYKESVTKNGKLYYDAAVQKLITAALQCNSAALQGVAVESGKNTELKEKTATDSATVSAAIFDHLDFLKKELETKNFQLSVKDEQLNAKDKQIENLQDENKNLNKTIVFLSESLKAAQVLHAGTIQKQIENTAKKFPEEKETKNTRKTGFFSKFFGKNRK